MRLTTLSFRTRRTACSACAWRAGLNRRRRRGRLHGRARRADKDGIRLARCNRRIPDQRRRQGRRSLVNPRPLVLADRPQQAATLSTIAIFDQPKNPGYPTTGMRAAMDCSRPIRWASASSIPREPPMNFTLEKGQSATFRYRIVFYTHAATEAELNKRGRRFRGGIQIELQHARSECPGHWLRRRFARQRLSATIYRCLAAKIEVSMQLKTSFVAASCRFYRCRGSPNQLRNGPRLPGSRTWLFTP